MLSPAARHISFDQEGKVRPADDGQEALKNRGVVSPRPPLLPPDIAVALVLDGRTLPPSRSFYSRAAPPSAEELKLGHRAAAWPARCHSAGHVIRFHGDSSYIRHLQASPQLRIPPRSRLARGHHCVFGYPNNSQRPSLLPRSWVWVAERSTFGTRAQSLESIEREVAFGWHLAPSETSQAVVCSLVHRDRCGAPNSSGFSSLTIAHSRLGDLQHHPILPIIFRLLLSTKADNLPLPGHLHDPLCRHSHLIPPPGRPEPLCSRRTLKRDRMHTRPHLALFGFISPCRAGYRKHCPRGHVEDFQRPPDDTARSV